MYVITAVSSVSTEFKEKVKLFKNKANNKYLTYKTTFSPTGCGKAVTLEDKIVTETGENDVSQLWKIESYNDNLYRISPIADPSVSIERESICKNCVTTLSGDSLKRAISIESVDDGYAIK